jgi:tetratricopeptide (TPR) repeat protein
MTPYHYPVPARLRKMLLLVTLVIAFGVNPAQSGTIPGAAASDALTKSGLEHFYSLEYTLAIKDFQKVVEANPDDPKALNHLIESILFRELYKYDALDTSLYTHQGFINSKQVPLDSNVKKQFQQLTDKALGLSAKRLKANPQDVEALYSQGVTKGLRSTYLAMVEHSWFAALRSALAARSDHEQVLKLRPSFVDAKTVVGAHNYVVGSLPLPFKIMAGITGIHGDKNKGLDFLMEAGKAGGESSADARVALALFLRREERFQDAINVVHTLVQEHPRNFLFAVEEANLMKDAGKGPEAITAFRNLLDNCKQGKYPEAHVELGQYAFAETLRGQNQYAEALQAYEAAANSSSINQELRQRAYVAAGEVSDLLTKREEAVQQYRAAVALDSSTNEAEIARKYIHKPYKGR